MSAPGQALSYRRGAVLMLAVVLPLTLAAAALLMWMDPGERSSLPQVLGNNALPLYVLSALPAVGISLLHTRLLRRWAAPGGAGMRGRSVALGLGLGLALAVALSALMWGTLHPAMWALWAWGAAMGVLYGVAVAPRLAR